MDNTSETRLSKLAEERYALILIQCSKRETDVVVDTDFVVDGDKPVRIKFDDATPSRQRWNRSADHTALFAPDGMGFVRELVKHQRFLIEFSRYDKAPLVAEFKLDGLSDKLPAVEKACEWSAIDASRVRAKAAAEKAKKKAELFQRKMEQELAKFVEPCRVKWYPAGTWCWHDGDNTDVVWRDSAAKATKDEALADAVRWAKEGKIFQSVMAHLN